MTYEELAREYGEACKRNLEKDAEIERLRMDMASITDCLNTALRESGCEEAKNPTSAEVKAGIDRLVYRVTKERIEIERLRSAIAMMTESRKSADIAVEKLAQEVAVQRAEIERLRQAMIEEADAHDSACSALGATPCWCPFCMIAREGR